MSTVTRHNKCTLPTLALRSAVQWVRDVCAAPPATWEPIFESFVTFLLYKALVDHCVHCSIYNLFLFTIPLINSLLKLPSAVSNNGLRVCYQCFSKQEPS